MVTRCGVRLLALLGVVLYAGAAGAGNNGKDTGEKRDLHLPSWVQQRQEKRGPALPKWLFDRTQRDHLQWYPAPWNNYKKRSSQQSHDWVFSRYRKDKPDKKSLAGLALPPWLYRRSVRGSIDTSGWAENNLVRDDGLSPNGPERPLIEVTFPCPWPDKVTCGEGHGPAVQSFGPRYPARCTCWCPAGQTGMDCRPIG